MFYLIVAICPNGSVNIHICKATSIEQAEQMAGQTTAKQHHTTLTEDEINALQVIDRGCISKYM